MWIKIPVYWYPDDFEEKVTCRLKAEPTIGEITINTECLVGYHKNDQGTLMFRFANGEVFESPLDANQFIENFPELMARVELCISTEN